MKKIIFSRVTAVFVMLAAIFILVYRNSSGWEEAVISSFLGMTVLIMVLVLVLALVLLFALGPFLGLLTETDPKIFLPLNILSGYLMWLWLIIADYQSVSNGWAYSGYGVLIVIWFYIYQKIWRGGKVRL
jgi:hypothetical protein